MNTTFVDDKGIALLSTLFTEVMIATVRERFVFLLQEANKNVIRHKCDWICEKRSKSHI